MHRLTPDFRRLFEASPSPMLVLSPGFHIDAVNEAYLQATMTTRQGILGRPLFEVFPDNPEVPFLDGTRNLRASLERVIQSRVPDTMAVQRYDIRRPESAGGGFEERYWSPLNVPVFDEHGKVAWIVHRVEDVTELVRLKLESERQTRTTEELKLRTRRVEQDLVAKARELLLANERLKEAHDSLERMRSQELQAIAAHHDAEIQARDRRFRAAIEASLDGFDLMEAVRDGQNRIVDFRIVQVNAAIEQLVGMKREQLEGRLVCDVFPVTRTGGFLDRYIEVVETRKPWTAEFAIDADNIHAKWLQQQVVAVGDGVAVFTRNITEQKHIEAQLRHSQKMESIGLLAGGVAHDFNNLLTVIIGYANLLSDQPAVSSDPRMSNALRSIMSAGTRAAELTGQLLTFARRQIVQPRRVNLQELIPEAERMLNRIIGEDIELKTYKSQNLWSVFIDPGQVNQIIMNLAVNARDAMPRGGKLIIETGNVVLSPEYTRNLSDVAPGEYVMLAVSDTGHGMSESVRQRVFEPFFTTKEVGKGTGLGLATVYGIVKQARGHVTCYSEVNTGTTFKVYLPRAGDEASPGEARVEASGTRGNEVVLIVEDETMVREFAAQSLSELGYVVHTAAQAQDALDKVASLQGPLHLLLTDVVMPGISGKQLAQILQGQRPGLKVLYSSGYTPNVIVHHGVLDRGVQFLPKPYSPHELAAKVRQVLDWPGA
ncbi:MAG: PAS domain-containing protein [Planctomycetaceae bacterium]|nr:PAS domain-containing protein [Planctomycetaceae bacterium]